MTALRYLVSFIILFQVCSCQSQTLNKNIIIKGFGKRIPVKKLYLIEAYSWKKLDSTKINNNKFEFNLSRDTIFRYPFLVSIVYFDQGKMQRLYFLNEYLSRDGQRHEDSGFMLEKDSMIIKEDKDHTGSYVLKGGTQNEAFKKYSPTGFGYISSKETNRNAYIYKYIQIIKQYPSSYYLLDRIWQQRQDYQDNELKSLLNSFDNDVKISTLGENINNFVILRNKQGQPYKEIFVKNQMDEPTSILERNKFNILIFWASWCGPCRMEIPRLKAMYGHFKEEGVKVTSLSIDVNKEAWLKAVSEEKMDWSQLILEASKAEDIKAVFNVGSIPLIIITNKDGIEVGRINGFDSKESLTYFIDKFLK